MPSIDKNLIEKYIKGLCTPEEMDQVHQWIDERDTEAYPVFFSERKYQRKEYKNWNKLAATLDGLMPLPKRRKPIISCLLPYAAVLTLFFASICIYNYYTGKLWWTGEQFKTDYGETKQVNLSDGSVAILNAMSRLKIPKDYGKEKRELYLVGEAYFKVQKDKERPFVVYSNHVAIKALGTSFNVSSYTGDEIAVSLHEGSVEVEKTKVDEPAEPIVLLPGEEAVYAKGGQVHKSSFSEKERMGWMEHVLFFKDAGITQVIRQLERYYGVTFDYTRIKNRNWKLNGEYKNLSLKEVLESLSFNYNIRYHITGNKITLLP